jgi:hypothetical protein
MEKKCLEKAIGFYIISKQVERNCFNLLHNTLERVLKLFKSFHFILDSGPSVLQAFGSGVLQSFSQHTKRELDVLKAFTQYCRVLSGGINKLSKNILGTYLKVLKAFTKFSGKWS